MPTSRPTHATLRSLFPNAATLAGLTCGILSLRCAMSGDLPEAAWLIVYAVLFDQLDGTLARWLRTSSPLGGQLDSLADFVSFGLAPAFLVLAGTPPGAQSARASIDLGLGLGPALGVGLEQLLAILFIYACALRLARFNVAAESSATPVTRFHGFPSTLAGALVASSVLTAHAHGHILHGLPLSLLLGTLALLMILPPGPPKMNVLLRAALTHGRFWATLCITNLAAVYLFATLRVFPEYLLLLTLTYAILGTLSTLRTPTPTLPGLPNPAELQP